MTCEVSVVAAKHVEAKDWGAARSAAKEIVSLIVAAEGQGLGDHENWAADWKKAKSAYLTMIKSIDSGNYSAAERSHEAARSSLLNPFSYVDVDRD